MSTPPTTAVPSGGPWSRSTTRPASTGSHAALHAAGVAIVSTGSTAARIADAGVPVTAGRGAHRLPRVPRRPGQDPAPRGARRDPRRPAPRAAPRAARRPRHRGLRPGRLEPLPLHRDGRHRRRARRVRRADRHRRPLDGAGRRQEPPLGRDRHLPRRSTTTCSPRSPTAARPSRSAGGSPPTRSCTPPPTTWPSPSWMGSVLTDTSEGSGFPAWVGATWDKAAVLRYGENPHQPAAL